MRSARSALGFIAYESVKTSNKLLERTRFNPDDFLKDIRACSI